MWGGKTSLGLDCSGLLQLALAACGIPCPRDTDMQEQALGSALAHPHELTQLRRGDLLFWKGHVAIVRDEATLVHANAHHMAVAFEAIAPSIARIRAAGGEVTSVRRLAAALLTLVVTERRLLLRCFRSHTTAQSGTNRLSAAGENLKLHTSWM